MATVTSESTPRRTSAEERQFSLVLALIATETGLSKTQILSTVEGYSARYIPGADNASLERQFERDKDDLRDLGIPLETIDQPGADGDTKLQRYRVSRAAYPLPDDITFSTEELALLGLAAQVWRSGSLSEDSRRALTKLRGLGLSVGDEVIGVAPTLRTHDRAHAPLTAAIGRGRQVEFDYLKPGDSAAERRRVSPFALVQHESRWHLLGFDESRGGERTFLLQRIVGAVRQRTDESRPAGPDAAERALRELRELWNNQVAIVRAEPGSEAEVVLRNRGGSEQQGDLLRVRTTDLQLLADELAGFGDEVQIHSPPELVAAVLERWITVAASHG
jgi:proteasome accessory factor B